MSWMTTPTSTDITTRESLGTPTLVSSSTVSGNTAPAKSAADLIAFGLGGNVGDREAVLGWAVERLRRLFGPLRVAPLYRTAPVSPIPQSHYFNTVILADLPPENTPDPREVLMQIKTLERRTGRREARRDAPRTLDIDLLFFGEQVRDAAPGHPAGAAELILPHPRMRGRRFVLAPLNDIAPELRLPPDGARVKDLLAALGSLQQIEKIGWSRH